MGSGCTGECQNFLHSPESGTWNLGALTEHTTLLLEIVFTYSFDLKHEHTAALIKFGSDEETVESSKPPSIEKNRMRLSGAARKWFKYLIKQGLPADEARVESVEPVKKESKTKTKNLKGSSLKQKFTTVTRRKKQENLKEASVTAAAQINRGVSLPRIQDTFGEIGADEEPHCPGNQSLSRDFLSYEPINFERSENRETNIRSPKY
ncbi:hypothetical protein JTB14_002193 [Gonioctena quinquepunctata]|nr:hypothetical protein JTB14_002193 [Gonioctena quinquepunctata]